MPKTRTLEETTQVVRRFNRFYTAHIGILRRNYLDSGLSYSEARILYEIMRRPECTATDLRSQLSLDAGYMSRLLTSFAKRGWIGRKQSRKDRRETLLYLTQAGKRDAERLDRRSSAETGSWLKRLPPDQRLGLVQAMQLVQQVLASPAVEVTRASASDLRDATTLLHEYYEAVGVVHRDTQQDIKAFLQEDTASLWIAYQGNHPAGCVVLRPLPGIRSSAECKRLYVRPDFRRQGVAEALLDAMEAFARHLALDWIYLDSKKDLQVAIALYKRRGYKECARYNDNSQATIFMRKKLKAG